MDSNPRKIVDVEIPQHGSSTQPDAVGAVGWTQCSDERQSLNDGTFGTTTLAWFTTMPMTPAGN